MASSIVKPRAISGFADYDEFENVALSQWIRTIEGVYRRYGFSRLFPRPLELREVLLSRGGIQKQVFGVSRVQGDRATHLALPFDRTVPLANWVALKAQNIVFPYKRYDISYSFRGERAQAGRFQGFFQADVDIIGQGTLGPAADSECLATVYEALSALEVGDIWMTVSHMGIANSILTCLGVSENSRSDVLRLIDKLEKVGPDAVAEELANTPSLGEEKISRLLRVFMHRGETQVLPSVLGANTAGLQQSLDDVSAVVEGAVASGIPREVLVFRPDIVRGLDYYSGTVFETFIKGMESVGSVASGGRYDDLASTFSDASFPGVGGSIGVTRLLDAMLRSGTMDLSARTEANCFVGFREETLRPLSQHIAKSLRMGGLAVDLFSGDGPIRKQLSYANRKGFEVAVLVMDEGAYVVKNLHKGSQTEVPSVPDVQAEVSRLIRAGGAG